MNFIDAYYKQDISYKHQDTKLKFKVSQDLFSSTVIDHGTQRLLRTLIFEKIDSYEKALDLGCGYGPIGITLKAVCPEAEVHLVDPDALALAYTKKNVSINNVGEVKVYASLGYENISDQDFDLIVSNIPAKVGEPVLRHMIKDSRYFLKKDGRVVIVVIDPIADFIQSELENDDSIDITYHRSWPGHQVFHYIFNEPANDNSTKPTITSEYYRNTNSFKFKSQQFVLDTTHNLPEFDTLSYSTEYLLEKIAKLITHHRNVLCLNPKQGYIPLALTNQFSLSKLSIIDRDLLALRTTKHNLQKNEVDLNKVNFVHTAEFDPKENNFDLVTGIIPSKLNIEVYKLLLKSVKQATRSNAELLFCSSSTTITRIEELLSNFEIFEKKERDRHKGMSLLRLKK